MLKRRVRLISSYAAMFYVATLLMPTAKYAEWDDYDIELRTLPLVSFVQGGSVIKKSSYQPLIIAFGVTFDTAINKNIQKRSKLSLLSYSAYGLAIDIESLGKSKSFSDVFKVGYMRAGPHYLREYWKGRLTIGGQIGYGVLVGKINKKLDVDIAHGVDLSLAYNWTRPSYKGNGGFGCGRIYKGVGFVGLAAIPLFLFVKNP